MSVAQVCERLETSAHGVTSAQAAERLQTWGHNAIRSHGASWTAVLLRQLRSPLLALLVIAAAISATVGEASDAAVIGAIVALSVVLGFYNEYRSERAVEKLHETIRHNATVVRDGRQSLVDVTDLVPGDVVLLDVGDVVPADLRLTIVNGLECDQAVLTGESLPAPKSAEPSIEERACIAFMGTVVTSGTGEGMVFATAAATEFGQIADQLGRRQPVTAFQLGLRDFSLLLVRVTLALTVSIFIINTLLQRPVIDALLFSLAIAIGLTPQLLPAIVTISLSTGARRLAQRKVVVKRLVAIEDLGNITTLFTDKTGTLTTGSITLQRAVDGSGTESDTVLALGLICNSAVVDSGRVVSGNVIDTALWRGAHRRGVAPAPGTIVQRLPFDYQRRLMSVVAERDGEYLLVTKGAPETLLQRCTAVSATAHTVADRAFRSGSRTIAIATKPLTHAAATLKDEEGLRLEGFILFDDPLKEDAAHILKRLRQLDVTIKIITGDNAQVAATVAAAVGLRSTPVITGSDLEQMSDQTLSEELERCDIFARISPEQKSRIIRVQRQKGADVGFLGDGVNDAVALRDADVGISVQSATEVAKDAADIVLTDKDLGILADGIVEGRRIFANTIKYVLMGTSSNFGNMFSAAGGSIFLPFLPMLPTQILLNNLLYDVSEMSIPTDRVDAEMLRKPAHWDVRFIRRFMVAFGPISSAYDFLTFAVMLWIFHAHEALFHSGWFVESLATQTLVVFVIRTRRVPFMRSRPSPQLLLATLLCCTTGALLPFSPFAPLLGFTPLPLSFLAIVFLMVVTYLAIAQTGVAIFFGQMLRHRPAAPVRPASNARRVSRLASRWSHAQPRRRAARSHHG